MIRFRESPQHPFREFILKVHQRCNLACDYCYVYTMADQSWRTRPAVMAEAVWRAAATRIAEHAERHALPSVRLILHGGEPLLAGTEVLTAIVEDTRAALPAACELRISLQTNGLLLTEEMLRELLAVGVQVGVSLDGRGRDNDRHRLRPNGRGSHADVDRALTLLTGDRYRGAFGGLLCTVDIEADPVATYEALLRYRPPMIDFLLPHANWARPPIRPVEAGPTPYGDWLIAIFERWYGAPHQETRVRILEEVINLVLGGASRCEHVGLSPAAMVVIESDGSIEQVDSLKSTYPGASETGLNVFADAFDDALRHPGIVARQIGVDALCDTCLGCEIHAICGGGNYVHRYSPERGFRNPSSYCSDLYKLITHIRSRVGADLAARLAAAS